MKRKYLKKAVENGQKIPCPGCGLSGMKDDACTHMTCPGCQCSWCYFCGLQESDCDKAERVENEENSIYLHNKNWEINPKRCPMYLTGISDIDESWPDDEHEALEYYHRLRSLKLLRAAYEQIGAEKVRQLNEQFGIVQACGFTLQEIKYADITLIQYGNHCSDLSTDDDDDDDNDDDDENLFPIITST